jgi:drug/metabolite transporter (DMT)-like permease
VLRHVDRIAAVVLILAGAYLVYYWAFVSSDSGLRSGRGGGLARVANDLTDDVSAWLQRQDALSVGLLLGAVVAVALAFVVARRNPTR